MSGLQLFGLITVCSTGGILIVCFILYAILQRKRHFRCPKCGAEFKVSPGASFFAARDGTDKRLTCPQCGWFGYMEDRRDDDKQV